MLALLVDANSYIHAQYHGTGELEAYRGMLRMMRVYQEINGAIPLAFFDCDGPTWRHAIYPDYKAGRKEKEPGLVAALNLAREKTAEAGYLGMTYTGYEADDMLACRTHELLKEPDAKVIICSRDKDMRQLLKPGRVTILKKFSSCGNGDFAKQYYTAKQLYDEEGLTPANWPEFRALTGDESDNWPGAEGIGPVKAKAILQAAGTLAEAVRLIRERPMALPLNAKQRESLYKFDWELGLRLMLLRNTPPGAPADGLAAST